MMHGNGNCNESLEGKFDICLAPSTTVLQLVAFDLKAQIHQGNIPATNIFLETILKQFGKKILTSAILTLHTRGKDFSG